jgi:octaprenyl-diphosphate synthase
MNTQSAQLTELEAELRAVHTLLAVAADGLGSPLGELVRAEIKQAAPPLRAALVLVAGYDPAGDDGARQRRVALAAALEMLTIALHIHRRLVDGTGQQRANGDDLELSLIGSTILAGDYCFSRAAALAAQTDSPKVVSIFAQALQTVSEGQLRVLFYGDAPPFDDNTVLLRAGANAAVELAGVTLETRPAQEAAAHLLAQQLAAPPGTGLAPSSAIAALSPARQARQQSLVQWLDGHNSHP